MAPRVGFEPTTLRLTAGCSAVELPRNFFGALRFLGARKYYKHFNFRRNPLFQKFFQQPIPGAWVDSQPHPNTSISLSNSAGHVRLGRTRNKTEAFRRIMAENANIDREHTSVPCSPSPVHAPPAADHRTTTRQRGAMAAASRQAPQALVNPERVP